MARKATIDYSKPFYIHSYDANEILVHMMRGAAVSAANYGAGLSVSLDSLKIQELCGKKEMKASFPSAFHTVGKGEYKKTYSEAMINVKFSGQDGFLQEDSRFSIPQINEDYEQYQKGITEFSWAEEIGKDAKGAYLEMLEHYRKNQSHYQKQRKETRNVGGSKRAVKALSLALDENYRVREAKTAISGTTVKLSLQVNKSDRNVTEDSTLLVYVTRKEETTGNCRILGVYQKEDVFIKERTGRISCAFDFRDVMEAVKFPTGVYECIPGEYVLFLGNAKESAEVEPVALLRVNERIEQARKDMSLAWLKESDWPLGDLEIAQDQLRDLSQLTFDFQSLISFKKCGKCYADLIKFGSEDLLTRVPMEAQWELKTSQALRIRGILYHCGITVKTRDGEKHYRMYKRSAGKAKSGSCLFILDELYDEMFDWTWMGHRFDPAKMYDLTSIKAYEALTLSNILKSFSLKPKNILLIESIEGAPVRGNRRIVCSEACPKISKGKSRKKRTEVSEESVELRIHTVSECAACPNQDCSRQMTTYRNKIWDGQALLDESVFEELFREEDGHVEPHGMVLLRNKFMKACAFQTRISAFYEDHQVQTVYDMFGGAHKASDIKLIITPDTLKVLKFAEVFEQTPKDLYREWLKNLSEFGVVKWDKSGEGRGSYKVGYQVLNTLPLSEACMEELFTPEKELIRKLWDDDALFLEHISTTSEKAKCIYELYHRLGPDYAKTADFINYKTQWISDYKRKLRRGEIHLAGDMYILCSMPYEMLWYSANAKKNAAGRVQLQQQLPVLLSKDEVYISGMQDDDPVMLCRYPHLSTGSVCTFRQKECTELDRYFRFQNGKDHSNIVVVSPWENNVMVKLGGADFDSDTALFIKEPVVLDAVAQLQRKDASFYEPLGIYGPGEDGLPIAQAGAALIGNGNQAPYTETELAKLDHSLSYSQTAIGSISNDVQLFNCYLWEELHALSESGGSVGDAEKAKLIYECILKLAVLNELEIDRAKHSIFLPPSTRKKVLETAYRKEPILSSTVIKSVRINKRERGETESLQKAYYLPSFLYEIKKERGNTSILLRGSKASERYWDCPPDYLAGAVSKLRKPRTLREDQLTVYLEMDGSKEQANTRQLKQIKERLCETIDRLSKLDKDRVEEDEKFEQRLQIRETFMAAFGKEKLTAKTLQYLIRDTLNVKEDKSEYWDAYLHKHRFKVMGLLLEALDPEKMFVSERNLAAFEAAMKGLYIAQIKECDENDELEDENS